MDSDSSSNFVLKEIVTEKKGKKQKQKQMLFSRVFLNPAYKPRQM